MRSYKLVPATLAVACLAAVAVAQEHAHHGDPHDGDPHGEHSAHDEGSKMEGGLSLSPELKGLLTREMFAIQDGMQALVPAIAAGEWDRIAEIGHKIHDSYILRQELSEAQLEELHHALPAEFVEMDHAFHHSAGRLAHAAEARDADVVGFYFYKLNEGCVRCHSKYASQKFPGLASSGSHEGHH